MQKFIRLIARGAHLPVSNVDTDMIIPKQFLKTIKRTGLGKNLFDEMRYDDNGKEKAEFVLNKPAFRDATLLVSGENFGCGSSREHAPWAILDFGIRCVIAPSFADIFYNNCFKNGVLPITLPAEEVKEIGRYAEYEENEITVDLPSQTIKTGTDTSANPEGVSPKIYKFEIDEFRKHCLVNGLDDIGLTLQKEQFIEGYEEKRRVETPWLF